MRILLFLLLVIGLSNCTSTPQVVDVPWFVKLRVKEEVAPYAYQDSLAKYQDIRVKSVVNPSNFLTYLSDLEYNNGDTSRIRSNLHKALQKDSAAFCQSFIQPIEKYLIPNHRPHRRYQIPFILAFDTNLFFSLRDDCLECCKEHLNPEFSAFDLEISYLFLMDQWYRIPGRKSSQEQIIGMDTEVRQRIDVLYQKYPDNFEQENARDFLYTILLHSTDCDWTERWLNFYLKHYLPYPHQKDDMQHLIWRSSCMNDELKEIIRLQLESSSTF